MPECTKAYCHRRLRASWLFDMSLSSNKLIDPMLCFTSKQRQNTALLKFWIEGRVRKALNETQQRLIVCDYTGRNYSLQQTHHCHHLHYCCELLLGYDWHTSCSTVREWGDIHAGFFCKTLSGNSLKTICPIDLRTALCFYKVLHQFPSAKT